MSDQHYSYDKECELLADYFLADDDRLYGKRKPYDTKELAQAIQDAVEAWFSVREKP